MTWAPLPRVLLLALSFALPFSMLHLVTGVHRNGEAAAAAANSVMLPSMKATVVRKLIGVGEQNGVTDRMDESCSKDDIEVYQGPTAPLPNGIPTYTVQILNICLSGACAVSNIHVSCGWFSSARLINPRVFRRLGFDDCLVNDGAPLGPGQSLSFQYANTYRYPLYVTSVACEGE